MKACFVGSKYSTDFKTCGRYSLEVGLTCVNCALIASSFVSYSRDTAGYHRVRVAIVVVLKIWAILLDVV